MGSLEGCVSSCLSCCSVVLVGLALRPVPRGGVELSLIVCTGLDLGGSIPDGLASCGIHHLVGPLVPSGSRPGARPARPGHARGSDDLISPQTLGELLGGVLAPPVRVENRLSSCVRAPAGRHIDRLAHQGPVPRAVAPVAHPTAFLVQQPGGGRQADRAPPRVRVYRWMPPTHLLPRLAGGGSPRPDQVGTRARAQRPGGGGAESFRRGRGLTGPAHARAGTHRPLGGVSTASAGPGGVDPSVPAGWRRSR